MAPFSTSHLTVDPSQITTSQDKLVAVTTPIALVSPLPPLEVPVSHDSSLLIKERDTMKQFRSTIDFFRALGELPEQLSPLDSSL